MPKLPWQRVEEGIKKLRKVNLQGWTSYVRPDTYQRLFLRRAQQEHAGEGSTGITETRLMVDEAVTELGLLMSFWGL